MARDGLAGCARLPLECRPSVVFVVRNKRVCLPHEHVVSVRYEDTGPESPYSGAQGNTPWFVTRAVNRGHDLAEPLYYIDPGPGTNGERACPVLTGPAMEGDPGQTDGMLTVGIHGGQRSFYYSLIGAPGIVDA